jgi:hypothetical protein
MVLGIILVKKNGGPDRWTHGILAELWFIVHGGPRTGTVAGARRSVARRRSHAQDLAATTREARGGDGDLYPGWHETVEGLERPGHGGPRWRPEFLNERALEVRRLGKEGSGGHGVERWRCGYVL